MRVTPLPISGTLKHIPNAFEAILCLAQRAREIRKENHQVLYLTEALKEGAAGMIDKEEYLMKSVIHQLTKEKSDGKRNRSY